MARRARVTFAMVCLPMTGCGTLPSQPLSPMEACDNLLYADMASLAYHWKATDKGGTAYIPPLPEGWHRIDLKGTRVDATTVEPVSHHPLTGLAYDIWQNDTQLDTYVFAYRGSNAPNDWVFGNLMAPFSPPYRQARNELKAFKDRVGTSAKITAVGHSLGGGIALSMSLREDVPAVVFNSSPRINDGLGTNPNAQPRTLIFKKGEILQRVRFFWRYKLSQVIPEQNRYEVAVGENCSHRHDVLAQELRSFATACPQARDDSLTERDRESDTTPIATGVRFRHTSRPRSPVHSHPMTDAVTG